MSRNQITRPSPIPQHARIAVISPAGSIKKDQINGTLDLIESKGFKPVLGRYALGEYNNGYSYSGTPKERLEDLNWALNDPEIDAVWATRGGYGCQHLVSGIKLSRFRKKPKWYIGYSDNTVIQSYLLRKEFTSLHAQTLKTSSFGIDPNSYELIFDVLNGSKPKYLVEQHKLNRAGFAEGRLVGGNLALVYALLGTKYGFKFDNSILFIEEVGENFYALDRMITSLKLAGVFNKISGLVVGGMTTMGKEKENKEYEGSYDSFAYQLISSYVEEYDFPILFGFPNGHIYDNRPLIIGAECKLSVGKKSQLKFR